MNLYVYCYNNPIRVTYSSFIVEVTAICSGIWTAIGFAVGLADIFFGGWIGDWIDNNVK